MNTFIKHTLLLSTLTAAASAAQAAPAFSCCAQTDEHYVGRPDEHAPISVMGDHTHAKSGWMASYRYMHMDMDGMRHGTNRVSANDVFDDGYNVTPESMAMDMHMFGLMYAPTDQLTLVAMGNYTETEMDHRVFSGVAGMINAGATTFTTETSGIGDLKVGGLYRFFLEGNKKAHAGLSLSLPTGSIDEKDKTPGMNGPANRQLPAPMQLGSGTYDLLPSLTYVQQFENWSYGAQANAVIRLESENDNGYRLGNVFGATTWAGTNLNEWIGLNTGLNYTYTGKLKGSQKDVSSNLMMGRKTVTSAYGDNYGGERLDAIFGINCYVPSGALKGQRLAADIRLPLWQDLNGYQLETDIVLTIGWQMSF